MFNWGSLKNVGKTNFMLFNRVSNDVRHNLITSIKPIDFLRVLGLNVDVKLRFKTLGLINSFDRILLFCDSWKTLFNQRIQNH